MSSNLNLNDKYLERVQEMIDTLNSTNGANDKVDLIAKYSDLKPLIYAVHHPNRPFNVTSAAVKKFIQSRGSTAPMEFGNLLELLDALADRQITGHEALASVALWVKKYPHHTDLVYAIIDKDLKIRMGVKQLNKAFPKLIPTFDVALGHPIEKYPKALDSGKWRMSRKLDGVRCITLVNPNGTTQNFSRQGNEFATLNKLNAAIDANVRKLFPNGVVLDGEVCIVDAAGNEDFKSVMKEFRKKDHIMQNPKYLLFDCLTLEEFWERKSSRTLSERIKDLDKIKSAIKIPELQVIDQIEYTPNKFAEMNADAERLGWEGLIVRKDVGYEGTRTNAVLKVKKFETEEYKVVDVQFGPFQAHNAATKLTETIETLVSVTILHKNYPVSVGSGFSVEERKTFYKDPSMIKGKVISVQFFEETSDSDGALSLRFPTFKGLYGKARTF